MRQGAAGENTFNVLTYGSFHKRGRLIQSMGHVAQFSLSLSKPEVDPFEKVVKANSLFSPAVVLSEPLFASQLIS